MSKSIELSDFMTVDAELNEVFLCANNKANEWLYTYGVQRGVLFDILGTADKKIARIVSLKNFCLEECKPAQFEKLMAQATQNQIKASGITLSKGESIATRSLLGANILTGLCYREMRHKNKARSGAFVTKNPQVIQRFSFKYPIEGLEKGMERYREHFGITSAELKDGVFNSIILDRNSDDDTVKMKIARLHLNSKSTFLAPYFTVFTYRQAILRALTMALLDIQLIDGTKIKTTLAPEILRKNSLDSREVYEAAVSTEDLLSFILHDFISKKDVAVHMLEVVKIATAK